MHRQSFPAVAADFGAVGPAQARRSPGGRARRSVRQRPCPPRDRSGRRRAGGFTLIELLVVIALIAVFAAVAVPSYYKLQMDNRIAASLNAFAGTLATSRSEAVTRGVTVIMCPSGNATSTSPSCETSGTNWGDGWISFVDTDGSRDFSAGDTLLRVHGPAGGGVHLNDVGTGAAGNYIGFNRMGFAQPTFTSGATTLMVAACPANGNRRQARAVILGLSGTVRTATDTSGNGVVDDGKGTEATCP